MNSSRARVARRSQKQQGSPAAKKSWSARRLACEILAEAEKEKLYLDQILEKRLAHTTLPAADRALVTALTHGVMRARARLDVEIIQHFRKNYETAPPHLRNA